MDGQLSKDLACTGVIISRVIIIDDTPASYALHKGFYVLFLYVCLSFNIKIIIPILSRIAENAVPIRPWQNDNQ